MVHWTRQKLDSDALLRIPPAQSTYGSLATALLTDGRRERYCQYLRYEDPFIGEGLTRPRKRAREGVRASENSWLSETRRKTIEQACDPE